MVEISAVIEMTPEQRFAKYVQRTDACWLWTGAGNPGGYGQFRVRGVMAGAHRWAWEWANGPIPQGMQVHHVCRTRRCVNPTHLQVLTPRRNLQQRRFDSWEGVLSGVGQPDMEPLAVTLTPEQSAWVRARATETGSPADEIVERALYRYMARWLGKWQRP